MTRKKVKLAFIANDSARKATFKKRKKGLMKKVSELSTLCGIDACAIVYSPYEPQPDVWPDTRGAHNVVAQFKRMPEMEQSKKMVNQESFIRGRITKAADQLKKMGKENREKDITHLMYECLMGKQLQGLGVGDLNDMGWMIDQNLKEIYKRIESLKKGKGKEVVQVAAGEEKPVGVDMERQWFENWNTTGAEQQVGGSSYGGGSSVGDDMMMQLLDHGNNNVSNHHHNAAAGIWANPFFS